MSVAPPAPRLGAAHDRVNAAVAVPSFNISKDRAFFALRRKKGCVAFETVFLLCAYTLIYIYKLVFFNILKILEPISTFFIFENTKGELLVSKLYVSGFGTSLEPEKIYSVRIIKF